MFICPDYRFVFDKFRNPSTIIDVLDAYFRHPVRPTFANRLQNRLISVGESNDVHQNLAEWVLLTGAERAQKQVDKVHNQFGLSLVELTQIYRSEEYNDAHVWCLTPKSFLDILEISRRLELVGLSVERVHETTVSDARREFGVILKKRS